MYCTQLAFATKKTRRTGQTQATKKTRRTGQTQATTMMKKLIWNFKKYLF